MEPLQDLLAGRGQLLDGVHDADFVRHAQVLEQRPVGVPVDAGLVAAEVLDLLSRYKSHEDARRADTDLLARYIKTQTKNGELVEWTVRLVSSGLANAAQTTIRGLDVGLVKRAPFPEEQRQDRYTIRRLVSPTDEQIDLDATEKATALQLAIERWQNDSRPSKPKDPPAPPGGKEIRQCRPKTRGMLLLYPLDPQHASLSAGSTPIVGMAISFPKSDTATEVTYTVNNVFTDKGGDDDSL